MIDQVQEGLEVDQSDPGDGSSTGGKNGPGFLSWLSKNRAKGALLLILGWFIVEIATLPFGQVSDLRTKNPAETAFMREQTMRSDGRGIPLRRNQKWVFLTDMPKDVVNAVVVSEDGTFWWHDGFDWYEFRESVERNIKEGRAARGASTITQQLVKNLYLSSSKNPLRKLREWLLTWWMEQKLSKARILEIYMNVIEWGNGVYGVEAASETYFGKAVLDLTREEAARLAAIIPRPRQHRADEESGYLTKRTSLILERMAARGM